MSVTIKLTVSDEVSAQMELMCNLNATSKYEWIMGLVRDDMAVFFVRISIAYKVAAHVELQIIKQKTPDGTQS